MLWNVWAKLWGVLLTESAECVDGAGNIVTPTFLPLALIACMVGLASVFAGTNHLRIWRGDSLSSAASTSLIAWLLTLLAMGVACKEIHVGGYNRQKRLVSLALSNHSVLTQFMTNALLTLGSLRLTEFKSYAENVGSVHDHLGVLRAPVFAIVTSWLLRR